MLRCLVVLLALVLLLGGCSQNVTEPPAPTENTIPQTPPVTGIYMPDSAIEDVTDGAIQAFRLSQGTYHDCVMLGDDLLLMHTDGEDGVLTLYRGETLQPVREIRLIKGATPNARDLQINDQGFGYFDAATCSVMFFNYDLQVIGQVAIPETMQGNAWLTPDWKSVYYCTAQGIFVMDLQTGISRLLRELNAAGQQITGGFGNGEVIRCETEAEAGKRNVLLIDTATGVTLRQDARVADLVAWKDLYLMPYQDRGVDVYQFGSGEAHRLLWPVETDGEHRSLLENGAFLMLRQDWQSCSLAYYDLQTGHRKAEITLEGISRIWGIQGDGKGGVWFFAGNSTGGCWLYRWDSEKSLTGDETDHTTPRYTADAPDTEGLSQLEEKLQELEKKYGINIVIGEAAADFTPKNYVFTPEYLTWIYEQYLPKLEQLLSVFPQDIYTKTSYGKLQLVLVRSITGDVNLGTLPDRGSMQFWNGDTPVMAVALDGNFAYEFLRSFYLYMENRVLSRSDDLYEWYRQNPAEFAYDEDYVDNFYRTDTTYMEGEDPYFIDKFSMSYAREDRATIFAYGCLAEGEEYFKTPVLQKKLKRICSAIREAYGLKKSTAQFIWEQYKV